MHLKHCLLNFTFSVWKTAKVINFSTAVRKLCKTKLDPLLYNYLCQAEKKYEILKEKGYLDDKASLSKLQIMTNAVREIKQLNEELHQLEVFILEIEKDNCSWELLKLAREDKNLYLSRLKELETTAINEMLPEEKADNMDVIIELSAGVGGQEAMLFTKDIFHMYCGYSQYKKWGCQVLHYDQTDMNGLRHATLSVTGPQVGKYLKFEGGVHRVQRVPKTERSGRIHTSTATVAILPQPSEAEISLNDKDLRIDTMRASGPGGQNVNKTESAVRVTHLPTGISAECQTSRAQHQNLQLALDTLRARLYQRMQKEEQSQRKSARKLQVGIAARSDKIRTYNFVQDRITDHRLNCNYHNMVAFLSGGHSLDALIGKLQEESRKEALNQLLLENQE